MAGSQLIQILLSETLSFFCFVFFSPNVFKSTVGRVLKLQTLWVWGADCVDDGGDIGQICLLAAHQHL